MSRDRNKHAQSQSTHSLFWMVSRKLVNGGCNDGSSDKGGSSGYSVALVLL